MNKSEYERRIADSDLKKENFYHKLRALEIIASYIPDDDRASALVHLKKISEDITEIRRKWWDFARGHRRNMKELNKRLDKLIKLFPDQNLDNYPDEWFSKPQYESFKSKFSGNDSWREALSYLKQLISSKTLTQTEINKMIANAPGARLPDEQRNKSIRNTFIKIGILSLVVIISAVLIGLTYGGITPVLGSFILFPLLSGTCSLMGISVAVLEYPSKKNEGMAAELEEAVNQAAKVNEDVTTTDPISTPEIQHSQFPDRLFKAPKVDASVITPSDNTALEDSTLKPR